MSAADNLVGKTVRVTMANDVKYEGVVFSFVPDQDLMIILRHIQDSKASMHMIRLPFVKEIEATQSAERLPPSLDRADQLPTLHTTSNNLQKSIWNTIKTNSDVKNTNLSKLDGAPAGAVSCFLKLSKFASIATWDSYHKSILFGDVAVTSDDDWKTWKVTPVNVGGANEDNLKREVERVKGYLKK